MVTRVVPVPARADVGDTVMVGGRPLAVAHLLPRLPGRAAVRHLRKRPALGCLAPLLVVSGLPRPLPRRGPGRPAP